MSRWMIGGLVLTTCAVATACGGGAGGGEEDEPVDAVVAVDTAVARTGTFIVRVEALGEIVARPGRVAEMAAPAASRVSGVYVVPGQRVAEGDSLVALDRSVWAADLRRAEATADATRREVERVGRLVAEGILPRRDAEQAAAAAAAADADLAAARRVDRLGVLRSPISGVVADMNAVLEASADPGTVLVRIVDPDALEGLFRLSPEDAGRVEPGADVEVASSGAADGMLARGTVRAVSPAVDPSTRTVAVRVRLVSPARRLRLGEALTGRLAVATHAGAVVIPVTALVPAVDGARVFVVDGEGVAHARPVTVGGRDAGTVEILEGLLGGETVVTTGAYGVTDGATVRAGS